MTKKKSEEELANERLKIAFQAVMTALVGVLTAIGASALHEVRLNRELMEKHIELPGHRESIMRFQQIDKDLDEIKAATKSNNAAIERLHVEFAVQQSDIKEVKAILKK